MKTNTKCHLRRNLDEKELLRMEGEYIDPLFNEGSFSKIGSTLAEKW